MRYFNSCRFEGREASTAASRNSCFNPRMSRRCSGPSLALPGRIDIAIEYLGMTPEEYRIISQGTPAPPCGERDRTDSPVAGPPRSEQPGPDANANPTSLLTNLRGIQTDQASPGPTPSILELPEFLRLNCLSYCEFIELWQCGYVAFSNALDEREGAFPVCEPCCLDKLRIGFGRDREDEQEFLKLAVFIRLWRKLREPCCRVIRSPSFAISATCCRFISPADQSRIHPPARRVPDVARRFPSGTGGSPSDGFRRRQVDADRTHLLALWSSAHRRQMGLGGATADRKIRAIRCAAKWDFGGPASSRTSSPSRSTRSSHIVGFDPASQKYTWHALPTHTLRFAEDLAKLYASPFSVRDITYLFTAKTSGHGHWPFPMQDADEALAFPLDPPHERHEHSLSALRHQLLDVHIEDAEKEAHEWRHIASELRTVFGFADARHPVARRAFLPHILHRAGMPSIR